MASFSNRPSDRPQILHACADIGHISSHLKKLTHPTPGGFRGLPIQCHTLRPRVRSPCVLLSYYILHLRTAPSDRTAPKFGTHVRIDSLILKKKKLTPPPPQGGLGGYLLLKIFHDRMRPNFARMCGYIVSPQIFFFF